jgi:hypothetical protein
MFFTKNSLVSTPLLNQIYLYFIHYLIINCTGALYTVCTVQLFGNSKSLNGMKIFSSKHLILLHRMTNQDVLDLDLRANVLFNFLIIGEVSKGTPSVI